MYVSDLKLKALAEVIPENAWRRFGVKLGLGFPPFVSFEVQPNFSTAKLKATRKRVESVLRARGQVGTMDDPPPEGGRDRYVAGDLTMRWALDENVRPQVVWFVGSTDRTLVVLGGRAQHVRSLYGRELKDRSSDNAQLEHVEKPLVRNLATRLVPDVTLQGDEWTTGHWISDVMTVERYWRSERKDDFSVLALVEEYATPDELEPGNPPTAVLLGSPVFVFRAASQ